MKTIRQQAEITFSCIDFKDAVILLPLMDELVRVINSAKIGDLYNSLSSEEKGKYRHYWKASDVHLQDGCAERIYGILKGLGFESQIDIKEPTLDDLELKNN